MIYDRPDIVDNIKAFLQTKIAEKSISIEKTPLREDIFEILRKESILLYYPLDDEKVKGCHATRIINGEECQLVFINTIKQTEEQTWTAAHELGHVWGVEKKVFFDGDVKAEDVVNRFAAELLFPEKLFCKAFEAISNELGVDTSNLSTKEFVNIITFLMNHFCAPYKAVIRRFVEIGKIDKENEFRYMDEFKANEDYYRSLLEKYYYTRIGRYKCACSMEHVKEDIEMLLSNGIISETRANFYKKMFEIKEEHGLSGTFVIGG